MFTAQPWAMLPLPSSPAAHSPVVLPPVSQTITDSTPQQRNIKINAQCFLCLLPDFWAFNTSSHEKESIPARFS